VRVAHRRDRFRRAGEKLRNVVIAWLRVSWRRTLDVGRGCQVEIVWRNTTACIITGNTRRSVVAAGPLRLLTPAAKQRRSS